MPYPAYGDACGIKAMVSDIGAVLGTDNPTLRKEILQWTNARLSEAPGSMDLAPMIDTVLLCLEACSCPLHLAKIPPSVRAVMFKLMYSRG